MAAVTISNVSKRFAGGIHALQPTDLEVTDGELVVIVGPSGCGKSTLLRLIAGLEQPSDGCIRIGERDVTDIAPARRGVAMVFQSYALYPHLNVRRNLGFALEVAKLPRGEIRARVERVAATLGLTDLLERLPRALSGGQRQRVAIGRAVVREPEVLLLDEPLSNLDAELRVKMRHEFARLHQQLGTTMIYVTHDQLEAMTLANRIVVMANGAVVQVGAPMELYARPASIAVATAIGAPSINLVAGRIEAADAGGATVRLAAGGRQRVAAVVPRADEGREVTVGARPEHLRSDYDGPFVGRVELFERLGPLSFAHLGERGEASTIVAQLPGDWPVPLGETLRFAIDPADAQLFDAEGRAYPRAHPLTAPPSSPPR